MAATMSRQDVIRFVLLRSIGNFLVLFSLFGVIMTFGPAIFEEVRFRTDLATGVKYVVGDPTIAALSKQIDAQQSLFVGGKDKLLIPLNTDFDIIIPKIGANAMVIPNVDPGNETEYLAALKKGVAHARGSVFPGMQGTTYLFAHSTDNFWDVGRYNAVFYLLKDLQPEDQVTIFFTGKYRWQSIPRSHFTTGMCCPFLI